MQPPWISDVTKHPFVPLQVKEIATKIFDRIALSQYPYGTRIPAERDLAEEFKQSRATIRQALDFLAAYDVVLRKPGSGTFAGFKAPGPAEAGAAAVMAAGYPTISQLAETASPFAMNIAGSIIEPEMVRLATIYMSSRDIAELAQQVTMLETVVTEAETCAAHEEEIMMIIARGTHNSLIVAMYAILHEVRRHPQWASSRREMLTPARIRNNQQLFRSLFNAIERRNVETAVELITLHVSSTHETMIYES
ncbi:MAG: GntR family transcriptional regulator [Hyphomicrobiaceae bacterium]|nr:GntR family transcriptional regulator [Hyphomicrobiaceae bacterium]